MSKIKSLIARTGFKAALVIVSAAGLAACAVQNREPVAVSQSKPSITYSGSSTFGMELKNC